jgi:hypothetical protein
MVALPNTYKTADLPDTSGGGVVLIPPGKYNAVIVNSELKPTSKGDGHFLALTVVITQGPHANTEFVERLNIINPNQTAVEIAYKTLARIAEAVGMDTTPSDSVQLHNKPLIIEVETEAGKPYTKDGVERQGKDKSFIKRYHSATSGVASSAPFAAPAAQAAAGAPGKPPWAK